MIQDSMRFLIILLTFASFFFSNSIAENQSNDKKIQELLDDGYSITFRTMENGYFHTILEKKPTFKVVEGEIIEITPTNFLICKFNFEETVCSNP